MYSGIYKMAGYVISLETLYPHVQTMCQEYRCSEVPQIQIRMCQEDIVTEQQKNDREALLEGKPAEAFPAPYLESLAVYRKIAQVLLEKDTLLFHGSAIAVDGQAVLFTAKSGTGKSTHTRLWREMLGDRAFMVNDDKPLLRITAEGVLVCGTPWDGKHSLSTNCMMPLKAICILERGEENAIREINPKEALPMLLQQSFHPDGPRAMLQMMQTVDKLTKYLKFYRLSCNMTPEAAALSYETMLGK